MKRKYVSPSLDVLMVRIEKGFAASESVVNTYADEGEAGSLSEGQVFNW